MGTHGRIFQPCGETNTTSLALGGAALAVLILGKKFLPNRPVALLVVIGGIVVASFLEVGSHGVKVLGEVPSGVPLPSLPAVSWSEVRELLPLALACFLLGAVETAAIGRMFAEKHSYRLDSNQEFLALAAANLASGVGQGFPISGGMSQSLVNESGGARTPISGLIAAGIVLVVAFFFTGLLRNLPQPVLAAIMIMAVASLVKVKALHRRWQFHRGEFLVAIAALFGVLGAGLLKGVLIGATISLVLLIRRASSPHVAFLGRIPGARRYSDLSRHADNEATPGALPFRVESGIVYFNAEHVFDSVLARIDAARADPPCGLRSLDFADHGHRRCAHVAQSAGRTYPARHRLSPRRSTLSVRDMLRIEGVEETPAA